MADTAQIAQHADRPAPDAATRRAAARAADARDAVAELTERALSTAISCTTWCAAGR